MKEEAENIKDVALKLADELDEASKLESDLNRPENQADLQRASAMIRRLVEELDKQTYKADLLENRLRVLVGDKQSEPVGVVCEFEGVLVGTLFENLPDGTKLYTTPKTKPQNDY